MAIKAFCDNCDRVVERVVTRTPFGDDIEYDALRLYSRGGQYEILLCMDCMPMKAMAVLRELMEEEKKDKRPR